MEVGVIGLGAIGSGLARNLAHHHQLTTLWNRTAATGEAMAAELGVAAAASPADLAVACDVILISVGGDDDVLEMVDAMIPALDDTKVVVDTSTISVNTARDAAERVAATGACFLDAPVSGGREGAQKGALVLMVGGDPEAYTRALPALEAVGKSVTHMGEAGQGQATKAVNQIMAAGINQAVTEALAFGEAMGLDLQQVIDVVGGGAAGNWFLTNRGPSMVRSEYTPAGFKCALHHKDLEICRRMLDEMGVALPVVEMTRKHYEQLMEQGYGDEDISALYRLKRDFFAQGNKRSL